MAASKEPVHIDVVSDVVCPWCYIGKHRLERALTLTPDTAAEVEYRPYFLNPWIPREGIDRKTYLETKFGSVARYDAIAERVAAAAAAEGLTYAPKKMTRQPNTIDCHRLILWARNGADPARVKQRLMELYFAEGADLSDSKTLIRAAAIAAWTATWCAARLPAIPTWIASRTKRTRLRKPASTACHASSSAAVSLSPARSRLNISPTPSNAPLRTRRACGRRFRHAAGWA